MTPFVFKSPTLTELNEKLATQKTAAKHCKEEVWRLTKLHSPQVYDLTVTRANEASLSQFPVFALPQESLSVIQNDIGESESARNEEILKRTLAGEQLQESANTNELIHKAHRQWSAHEQAIEYLERQIEREKSRLATEYSASLKPTHDKLMKNMLDKMIGMHEAWTEVYDLKRHLLDSGVGLRGLCLTTPEDFLSTPVNQYSPIADFFRAAKRAGYIKEIPTELRA